MENTELITSLFNKEFLISCAHFFIVLLSLIIAITVIKFFWRAGKLGKHTLSGVLGIIVDLIGAVAIRDFFQLFHIPLLNLILVFMFWTISWFFSFLFLLSIIKTKGEKNRFYSNLYDHLTSNSPNDTDEITHRDSKVKILWYCELKQNILNNSNFNGDNKKSFIMAYEALGHILLNGFFQHDDPSRAPDYHLALYIYNEDEDSMEYFHGIEDNHWGDTASRKPKGNNSAVYKSYINNKPIRYPQDIKKNDLDPPLTRKLESFICVPVRENPCNKPIGVVVLDSKDRKDQFDSQPKMIIHRELLFDFVKFIACLNKKLNIL